jgi:sodium-dependent dicarboxylate transporter 2/3/5
LKKRNITKAFILTVAIGSAAWLIWGPLWLIVDGGENPEAPQRALAVFVLCLALWVTHVIPLAITGLLAFGLLPALGVTSPATAFSHLGNKAVFFMLGVFLLAAAMIATGLSKRLTLVLLKRVDDTPRKLFVGVLVTSSLLALWMPEHAVAAMMFPIVLEIVQALKLQPEKSSYARLLFMGLAWGAVIGGVGTFLGGARAPLAITLYQEYFDEHIGFLEWMIAALPVVIILTTIAVVFLPKMNPIDIEDISKATDMINDRVAHLGKMSQQEKRLAVLGLATVATWIGMGNHATFGLPVISIISACLLFMLRIVTWREIQDYVNWAVLLMYGGAIAIGSALHETKAMEWLVNQVLDPGLSPAIILIFTVIAAVVLTECVSNTATVAVLLPIGYSICEPSGISPLVMTLAVTIPAGLPFCLPISSPPHAIAFSAGYYGVRDVIKAGLAMDLIAIVVFILVMLIYWPMLGL